MSTSISGGLRPEIIKAFHEKGCTTPVVGITGGKGGVGKTTVAVNLACALADQGLRVALVDADVDAPNAAILLSMVLENSAEVFISQPLVDETLCTSCGECVRVCRANAWFLPPGKVPLLLGECNGCEACFLVCQAHALSRGKKSIGKTHRTEIGLLTLFTGALTPGLEESAFIVNAVRKRAFAEAEHFDIILVDTSPGAHCNVINALQGADTVLAVTEPTPLGAHDLEIILQLLDLFALRGRVVLNRSDLPGDKGKIDSIARKHGWHMTREIAMDDLLVASYTAGIPVVRRYPQAASTRVFKEIADEIAREYRT